MGTMIIADVRESADWTHARDRVQAQLLAYRVRDSRARARLVEEVMAEARREHAIELHRSPEEIAAIVTQRRVIAWIDALIGPSHESPTLRFARGRTAINLADLPGNWPDVMFDSARISAELRDRVRTTYLEAGPDLTFSNMGPRPIDLGPISHVADGTWRTFARWPVLRGVIMSAAFFGLLGTAFYLVRL